MAFSITRWHAEDDARRLPPCVSALNILSGFWLFGFDRFAGEFVAVQLPGFRRESFASFEDMLDFARSKGINDFTS